MKCDWFFIKETWNEVHEMNLFHEISWDFMRQKRVPQWSESPVSLYNFRITFFETIISIPFAFIFRVIIYTYTYTGWGVCVWKLCRGFGKDSVGLLGEKRREKKIKRSEIWGLLGLVLQDRMIAVHHSQLSRSYYAPLFSSEFSAREGDLVFLEVCISAFVCASVRVPAVSSGNWIRSRKK